MIMLIFQQLGVLICAIEANHTNTGTFNSYLGNYTFNLVNLEGFKFNKDDSNTHLPAENSGLADKANIKRRFILHGSSAYIMHFYYGLDNPVNDLLNKALTRAINDVEIYSEEKKERVLKIYSDNMLKALCKMLNIPYPIREPAVRYFKNIVFGDISEFKTYISELYCLSGFENILVRSFEQNMEKIIRSTQNGDSISYALFQAGVRDLKKWEATVFSEVVKTFNNSIDRQKIIDEVINNLSEDIDKELLRVIVFRAHNYHSYTFKGYDAVSMRKAFIERVKNNINMGITRCISETSDRFLSIFRKEADESLYFSYRNSTSGFCSII